MTQIEELKKLFEDFAVFFDKLSALQQQKVAAVKEDNVQGVDRCMQQEQAFILQLRGMQRQKEKLEQALNIVGVPLRKLSGRLSPADYAVVAQSMERFSVAYDLYVSAASVSRATLENNLRQIDAELQRRSELQASQHTAARASSGSTDIKV